MLSPILADILAETEAQEVEAAKKSVPADIKEWVNRLETFVKEKVTIPVKTKITYKNQDGKSGAVLEVEDKDKEKTPVRFYFLKEGDDYFLTVSVEEDEKSDPLELEDSIEKTKARRQETTFNEEVALKSLAKNGYVKNPMPPFKKMLADFKKRLKAVDKTPNESLYFKTLSDEVIRLKKDRNQTTELIKDPEVVKALETIRTNWGEDVMPGLFNQAIYTAKDYKYQNNPKDFIPLESFKLPEEVTEGFDEFLNRDAESSDDWISSADWLKELPEEERAEVEKALPENATVEWFTGNVLLKYPNPNKSVKIFFNKALVLEKAKLSEVSKSVTPELQDLIVERLNAWIEGLKESEEEYRASLEGMDGWEVHIEDLDDALDHCSDAINTACHKLQKAGVEDDVILEMLKEHSDEEFTDHNSYEDNEIGRAGTDGEEELYLEDAELSDLQAAGLPSKIPDELLNLLDDEHIKDVDEYHDNAERGEREYGTVYCYPGYRAVVLKVNEFDFMKAFRRMQKDVKMFQKQGAGLEEIRTMLIAKVNPRQYPTIARLICGGLDG